MIKEPDFLHRLAGVRRILLSYAVCMGGLAFALFLANWLCLDNCDPGLASLIGGIGLIALTGFSVWTVYRLLRFDANTLWTPAVIFPTGTALYFGFGSMSTLFSSAVTRQFFMKGSYGLDPAGLMQTTMLTAMGVALAVTAMRFAMRVRFRRPRRGGNSAVRLSFETTTVFFALAGALLKYGLLLPEDYGLINITVPGTLKSMSNLVDLGFAAMMFLAARGSRKWALIFWIFWPIHLGLTTLEFSKRMIVLSILLPAAGAYLAHQNWRRLIPWVAFAMFAFTTLQDVNTSARLTLLDRTGSIGAGVGFDQRLDLMTQIANGDIRLDQITSGARLTAQVWWLRLNYSGAQYQAMELYDSGRPGEWTLSLLEIFIPRFLWAEKPAAVAQGRIFNRMVSGNDEARTRVGMSVYADGYWQLGWLGAVLFASIMGFILGVMTRINYRFVLDRQLIYLPIVVYSMQMAALGPMGYLQKGFIAAVPIYLGYLLLIGITQSLLRSAHHGGVPRRVSETVPT